MVKFDHFFKKITFLFACSLICQISNGQTGQIIQKQNIVKPAPESAKFINYFLTPISTATGSSNIEIPIYTIEEEGLQVPITLSYHTSGIKVDDMSGSVGLGWSLNAGGGIYRNINGQADDRESAGGFLYQSINQSYVNGINNNLCDNESTYLSAMGRNSFDISQDGYYYNFVNNSGSLYLNNNKDFKEARNRNFVFNYNKNTINSTDRHEIDFLDARDKDGNDFYFSDQEVSSTYNSVSPVGFEPAGTVTGITAWKLSSITTAHRKNINFYYTDYSLSYNYVTGHTYTTRMPLNTETYSNCGNGPNDYSVTSTNFSTNNKLISQIKTSRVIVDFYYSDDPSLEIWKKRLDRIVVSQAGSGEVLKSVSLTYSSFQGNLTEAMGTGSVTVGSTRLRLDKVVFKDKNQTDGGSYQFKYNNGVLPKIGSYAKDVFGYYNGYVANWSLLSADILNVSNATTKANRTVNELYLKYGTLEEITYPTGGKKRFTYSANNETGVYGPGLRVDKIEAINESGTVVNTKTFEYSGLTGLKTNFPCNSVMQEGRYMDRIASLQSIGIYNSNYTHLSVIGTPKNFYYTKAITKEKGLDGIDLGTVENYGESNYIPYQGYSTYTEYNGEYQPDLHSIQYYKGTIAPENLIKEHNYTFVSYGNSSDDNIRYKAIAGKLASGITCPSYLTDCYSFYEGIENDQYLSSVTTVLQSEETKDYSLGGSIVDRKEYFYDNPKHYFPTRILSYNSDNSITEQDRKYVQDFDTTTPYDEMASINQISPVIEEKTIKNGLQLSLTKTNYYRAFPYYQMYLPQTIEIKKGSYPSEIRLRYLRYNNWGLPLSMQTDSEPVVNYIWSYASSAPIAEIINADYSALETLLGGETAVRIFASNSAPSSSDISSFLTPLRAALPAAQINTYTYQPLVGIASKTDDKGQTTYYEYDSFQRLKNVKDRNGDVIKSTTYHYKP